MKCEMCGLTDTNETAEQKAKRLKNCRRCRGFEEGRAEEGVRSEAELAGLGQRKQPIHAMVQYWLLRGAGIKHFSDLRDAEYVGMLQGAGPGGASRRYGLTIAQTDVLLSVARLHELPVESLAPFVETVRNDVAKWMERVGVTATDMLALRELEHARVDLGLKNMADFRVEELAFILSWVMSGKVQFPVRKGV